MAFGILLALVALAVGVVAGLLVPGLPSPDAAPPEVDPAAGELEMAGERSSA